MGLTEFLHKFYCLKMFLFNLFNKKDKVQYSIITVLHCELLEETLP